LRLRVNFMREIAPFAPSIHFVLLFRTMPPPLPATMNQPTAGPSSEVANSVDLASNNLSDTVTDKPGGLRGLVQTALDSK